VISGEDRGPCSKGNPSINIVKQFALEVASLVQSIKVRHIMTPFRVEERT
jgi:hypothetical protein